MTQQEIQELFAEASCFNCFSNSTTADLLKLALLTRISEGTGGGGTPGGADTQVQYNDGGAFGGSAGFTFNDTNLTVDLGGGTVVASDPVLSLTQTWNNAGVTFTGIDLNVTNTASAASSTLQNWRVGGTSVLSVKRSGVLGVESALGAVRFLSGRLEAINWAESAYIQHTSAGWRLVSTAGVSWAFVVPQSNGVVLITDGAATSFGRLQFGGTTSSFPALKRSTTILQTRLADDSAYAPFEADTVRTATAYTVGGTLPAAGTAGRRAYVTNSNASLTAGIGAVVAGGGANVVPVFDDGTNWRIG